MRKASVGELIDSHMDHEMAWIVEETTSILFRKNEDVKRGFLCGEVGKAVGQLLINRLGDDASDLTVDEFERVAVDSITAMTEEVFAGKSDAVSKFAARACVVYAFSRMMGMKSPYKPAYRHDDGYWPFGQEGGFCNPMKLKMMGD
jgi:hypothetical protein|nr:hypothetical protein [Neorhizobium tomejilense]